MKPIRKALVTAVDMIDNLEQAVKGEAPVKATDKDIRDVERSVNKSIKSLDGVLKVVRHGK